MNVEVPGKLYKGGEEEEIISEEDASGSSVLFLGRRKKRLKTHRVTGARKITRKDEI